MVLAAVVWAIVPLVVLVYHTLNHGGVVSGTDGALAGADQLFYMDAIRQSAQHVLITDHFDLALGQPVFLNPLYLVVGLTWLAGLSIQASYWLLQVLAAPVLAIGALAFVRRYLPSLREQLAAALLGVFYFSPLVALLAWTGTVSGFQRFELDFPAGESTPAWQLWGYPHAAICTGLLAATLAAAGGLAGGVVRRRSVAWMSAAGLLVGWLHPWQGATLIAVLLVLVLYERSRRLAQALVVPALATAAPMVYEAVLVRSDGAWRLDATQNTAGHVSLWMLLVVLLPIAIPAVAGLRAVRTGAFRVVAAAWPMVALAIYFGTSEFPYHALQGISIPLAALAVAGWPRLLARSRRLLAFVGAGLAALSLASGLAYEALTLRDSMRVRVAPYWLTTGERDALAYLDHAPQRGGVFADYYLGMAVPAFTGRRTWLGEWTWTPHFNRRQALADALMQGRMPASAVRRLVADSRARFVLVECDSSARVRQLLGSTVVAAHRFGCTAVYRLRR